jgi:hypothetical protein
MKGLINKYRQKKVYNTETGSVENASKSISILEDLWFPKRSDGRGTTVDTLQGSSTNFGGFDDIDYFVNKVYTSLNVPTNRRSKENRITINPTIDIEKDEMKFFKYIQKLRRKFNNLFIDLLKKDLIAKQVLSFDDWKDIQEKIKFNYASSNEISMIKKSQINDIKVNSANNALGLVEGRVISTQWIQKNLLLLSDEEIAEVNEQLQQQGGTDGQPDALGNAPMAGGGGEEVPGYTEVGGAAQPNMQPTPQADDGSAPQTDVAPKASGRFQQKARESNLSQDVIDNLTEGTILSDGDEMLIFENGRLKRI